MPGTPQDLNERAELAMSLRNWGLSRRDAEDTVRWATYGPGLADLKSPHPEIPPCIGIVVEEARDPELAELFALRGELPDDEFLALWQAHPGRASRVVLKPWRPQALLRYTITIERPRRLERRYLFAVHALRFQLEVMQRPGTSLWLIPHRLAQMPTPARTTVYDILGRCLPIGAHHGFPRS